MATHGWGKSPSVEAWLFDEGRRFDFFQAVALLEAIFADRTGVGEGAEPAHEAVRFQSSIALSFPETDIASIERPKKAGEPATMLVHFMGLAGALGPLPPPFAELVLKRAARRDTAARDFLDIFNHRLISLAYRVRKRHRIGLGAPSPERDAAARNLYAILGLAPAPLHDHEEHSARTGFPTRALLHHAGLIGREVRSMSGLEVILRHHFNVPVEAIPLTGNFHPLEADDRTAIGPSGQNRSLGQGTILGGRVWDQESSFELRIGPVGYNEFLRFLPSGDALAPLVSMTRFYAGETLDFALRLLVKRKEVPPARLGLKYNARLGYTSWIGALRAGGSALELRLAGAALVAARERARRPPAAAAQVK